MYCYMYRSVEDLVDATVGFNLIIQYKTLKTVSY